MAGMTAQAPSNPRLSRDNKFALEVLRGGSVMTKVFLEEAESQLRKHGLFDQAERDEGRQSSRKSTSAWLLQLARMAVMHWNSSNDIKGFDKRAWEMKMLKEFYHHLGAHLVDIEDEIKRLEREVDQSNGKHGKHNKTKSDREDIETGPNESSGYPYDEGTNDRPRRNRPSLSHYRKPRVHKQEHRAQSQDGEKQAARNATEFSNQRSRSFGTEYLPPQNASRRHDSSHRPTGNGVEQYVGTEGQSSVDGFGGSLHTKSNTESGSCPPEQQSTKKSSKKPEIHQRTRPTSTPRSISSDRSSEYSRVTRAPTISSMQSSPTTVKGGTNSNLPSAQQFSSPRLSQNARSNIAIPHAGPETPFMRATTPSQEPKAQHHRKNPKATPKSKDNQSRRTRSSQGTGHHSLQPDVVTIDSSTSEPKSEGVRQAQSRSVTDSNSTIRPHRSTGSLTSAVGASQAPDDNGISQSLPAQNQPTWNFANISNSKVRPPSGMSNHVGSRASSKATTRKTQSSKETSKTNSHGRERVNNTKKGQEDMLAVEDDGVSRISFGEYVRPARKKKCHHEGSDVPSYCDSLDSEDVPT